MSEVLFEYRIHYVKTALKFRILKQTQLFEDLLLGICSRPRYNPTYVIENLYFGYWFGGEFPGISFYKGYYPALCLNRIQVDHDTYSCLMPTVYLRDSKNQHRDECEYTFETDQYGPVKPYSVKTHVEKTFSAFVKIISKKTGENIIHSITNNTNLILKR